jgi:2,4-diketo-3-deoxy-L-fuconate hydrolase
MSIFGKKSRAMKIFRFGPAGQEKPGVEINGKSYDISEFLYDYDQTFWESGGLDQLSQWIENIAYLPEVDPSERIGPPLPVPSKIVCIGLNYRDHAAETGAAIPKEPVIFLKAPSSYCGPFDEIFLPPNAQKVDWEVELAIVISRKASFVSLDQAMDYVGGYTILNDVSERSYQMERGGTWDKGKGCDHFAPTGPFIISKNQLPSIQDTALWLKVNDAYRQKGTTKDMIFEVPYLVHYVSQFMTLMPGDLISTGTPAGVGLGMNPPTYLKPGDRVEMGIEGIGAATQRVVFHPSNGL